jgi:RNA polymerase sigma-70 factor (ECF subfamily)
MSGPGPESATATKEVSQRVEQLLAKLDAERREVLLLVDVEGYTVPEVATATGVNLNTLYTRLRSARQQFEDLVKAEAEELR